MKGLKRLIHFILITISIVPQLPFAQSNELTRIEGILVSVDLAQSPVARENRVCLSTFKTSQGKIVLVEDVYLCHYARKLKTRIGKFAFVEELNVFFLESDELAQVLGQTFHQAQFKFLEIE